MNGKKLARLLVVALLGVALGAGCGDDDDDDGGGNADASAQVRDLCEKADECDLLGIYPDVAACVDAKDECVADLSDSERRSWAEEMDDCNDIADCEAWFACWFDVPSC